MDALLGLAATLRMLSEGMYVCMWVEKVVYCIVCLYICICMYVCMYVMILARFFIYDIHCMYVCMCLNELGGIQS